MNGGRYKVKTRTIAWEIKAVAPGQTGLVEWEATINSAERISNEASVQGIDTRVVKSNIVQVSAVKPPRLGWIAFIAGAKQGEPPRVWMKDETATGVKTYSQMIGAPVIPSDKSPKLETRDMLWNVMP